MKVTVPLATLCFLALSCQTAPPAKVGKISREDAIAAAKKELERRHRLLPAGYMITVEEDVIDQEPGLIPIYQVTFSAGAKGATRVLYGVSVNRHSGATEDFFDERDYRPANVSLKEFLKSRKKNRLEPSTLTHKTKPLRLTPQQIV